MMEIRIATAKLPKFGHSTSGDTVECVERPGGGMTAILTDGQGHGRAAKRTSFLVAVKAVNLVADGARDGAVARAVHDYLYVQKDGKVSADLVLLSVDLASRTLVVSRNANTPVLLRLGSGLQVLDEPVEPIGVHRTMKPAITEVPIEAGSIAVAFSDGILVAGEKRGQRLPLQRLRDLVLGADPRQAQALADTILEAALEADGQQPGDDMSVVILSLAPNTAQHLVRRMSVYVPF